MKEDSQDSILNPEIKKFYLKYKEKISLASFSQTEIFSHYKELLSDDKFLIKIHFESLHNTSFF